MKDGGLNWSENAPRLTVQLDYLFFEWRFRTPKADIFWLLVDGIYPYLGALRRAERSLFAQEHVKMFSFFPVHDIPLRFISINLIFSAPIGRIYPIFVKTLRRLQIHDPSYSKFPLPRNFFRWVSSKKIQFSDSLEGKGYILESCL